MIRADPGIFLFRLYLCSRNVPYQVKDSNPQTELIIFPFVDQVSQIKKILKEEHQRHNGIENFISLIFFVIALRF